MEIKKILIIGLTSFLTCVGFAKTTSALTITKNSGTEIKLDGLYVFQAGATNQKLSIDKNLSDNVKGFAFFTEAHLSVAVAQEADNGIIAGGKFVIITTTMIKTSPSCNGTHVFIETNFGKIELGSPHDAASKMRITAYNAMVAGGGSWGKYGRVASADMQHEQSLPEFDSSGGFYIDSFTAKFSNISDKTEPSRKISYYTPKMQGFQFGISYIPDTGNFGTSPINNLDKTGRCHNSTAVSTYSVKNGTATESWAINRHLRNAISVGASYDYQISDDVAVKVAATAEYGKPIRGITVTTTNTDATAPAVPTVNYKLTDLNSYNIGALVTHGNFSYAASYGSLGNSLTSAEFHKVGRNTCFYNGAISYGQGPIKTSLSYFNSVKYKNTLHSITLGTEYQITKGVLPYVELGYFRAKGRPVHYRDAAAKKTSGAVALIGTKLKF